MENAKLLKCEYACYSIGEMVGVVKRIPIKYFLNNVGKSPHLFYIDICDTWFFTQDQEKVNDFILTPLKKNNNKGI